MRFFMLKTVGVALVGASLVDAHGYAIGISVAGVWYEGYNPTVFPYKPNPPTVVGWTGGDTNTGFVAPMDYASENIICHKNASPAGGYASVQAGDEVEVFWTAWPESHKGPVIDMLANCNGDCTIVNKTDLKFFKIAAVGRVNDTTMPGTWATDNLIANNNSWVIKIPSDLAEGNYVWRHEIIALHSAENSDGAQNYPQCFNLAVFGSGTLAPTGTMGEALYTESEAGILADIYRTMSSYDIPGPTQIAAGTNLAQSELGVTGSSTAMKTGVSGHGSDALPTTNVAAVASASAVSSRIVSSSFEAEYTTSSHSAILANSSTTTSAGATITAASSYNTAALLNSTCKKRHHARGFRV